QNGSILISELRALHPDLIVASSATDDKDIARAAKAARKAEVYQAPDDSITGVEETITDLGLITNHPADALRLVREIERKRTLVRQRLAGTRRVSVFVDSGFFTTFSNGSLVGDLLREAHA